MSILDKIVAYKQEEIARNKSREPESALLKRPHFERETASLVASLANNAPGIIAEFKRKSPSKQDINVSADPGAISEAYESNGAAAMSVLTDEHFFAGTSEDFLKIRAKRSFPMLRKDFMIDPYQVIEAKSMGADVILLIAEILSKAKLKELAGIAKELKLEILMEVHSKENLLKICDEVDVVGVNNRDLSVFKTDPEHSIRLFDQLPGDRKKISESGINNPDVVRKLRNAGYDGFLIGEHFMRAEDPAEELQRFIKAVMA